MITNRPKKTVYVFNRVGNLLYTGNFAEVALKEGIEPRNIYALIKNKTITRSMKYLSFEDKFVRFTTIKDFKENNKKPEKYIFLGPRSKANSFEKIGPYFKNEKEVEESLNFVVMPWDLSKSEQIIYKNGLILPE